MGKTNKFIKSKEFDRVSNTRRVDPEITKEKKRVGPSKRKEIKSYIP